MASSEGEKENENSLKKFEESILEFVKEYEDCFPNMKVIGNTVEIPVSSKLVWKLTMKIVRLSRLIDKQE